MEDNNPKKTEFSKAEKEQIQQFLSKKDLSVNDYRKYITDNPEIGKNISSIMCWPSWHRTSFGLSEIILERMVLNGKLEIINYFLNSLKKECPVIFPRGSYMLFAVINSCNRLSDFNVGEKILSYIKKALKEKTIEFADGTTIEHVNATLSGLKGSLKSTPNSPVTELSLTFLAPALYQSLASMVHYTVMRRARHKNTQGNDSFFIPDEFQLNVDDSVSDENLIYAMQCFSMYFPRYILVRKSSLDDGVSKILKFAVQLVVVMQSEHFLERLEKSEFHSFKLKYLHLYADLLHITITITLLIKDNKQEKCDIEIQEILLNGIKQISNRIIELFSRRAKENKAIAWEEFNIVLDVLSLLSYQIRLRPLSGSVETLNQITQCIETYASKHKTFFVTKAIVPIQKCYESILRVIKDANFDMAVKLDLMNIMIQTSRKVKYCPANRDDTFLISLLNCLQQTILACGSEVTTDQIGKNKDKIEKIIISIMSSFLSFTSYSPKNFINIVEKQQSVLNNLLIRNEIIDISFNVMESAVKFLKVGMEARKIKTPLGQADNSVIKIPRDLKVKGIIFILQLFSRFIGADKGKLFEKEKEKLIIETLSPFFDKKDFLKNRCIKKTALDAFGDLIIRYPAALYEMTKKKSDNNPIIFLVESCSLADKNTLLYCLSHLFPVVGFNKNEKLQQDLYRELIKKHFPRIEDMRNAVEYYSGKFEERKYENLKNLFAIFSEYYKADYIKKHSEEIADAVYQKYAEHEIYNPLTEFALYRVDGVKNSFKKMVQRALEQFYQGDPSRLSVIGDALFKEVLLEHISSLLESDRFAQNNIFKAAEQTYREIREQPPRKSIRATHKTYINSGVISDNTTNSCFKFFAPGCPIRTEDDGHPLEGKEKSEDKETPFIRAFNKRYPGGGNDTPKRDRGPDEDHKDGSIAKRQRT